MTSSKDDSLANAWEELIKPLPEDIREIAEHYLERIAGAIVCLENPASTAAAAAKVGAAGQQLYEHIKHVKPRAHVLPGLPGHSVLPRAMSNIFEKEIEDSAETIKKLIEGRYAELHAEFVGMVELAQEMKTRMLPNLPRDGIGAVHEQRIVVERRFQRFADILKRHLP